MGHGNKSIDGPAIITVEENGQFQTATVHNGFVVVCHGTARELKRTVRHRPDGTEDHVVTIIGVMSKDHD